MSRVMPAMADGRLTNYVSRCELNSTIQREFGITSESQYRMFLQGNPQIINNFTNTKYNSVLPYHNTTPCVTSSSVMTQQYMPPYSQ